MLNKDIPMYIDLQWFAEGDGGSGDPGIGGGGEGEGSASSWGGDSSGTASNPSAPSSNDADAGAGVNMGTATNKSEGNNLGIPGKIGSVANAVYGAMPAENSWGNAAVGPGEGPGSTAPGSTHGGPASGNASNSPTASSSSSTSAPTTAEQLALATQAGAVNSAEGAARSAGMSPAEAAQMGAQSGSSAYQTALPNASLTLSGQNLQQEAINLQNAQANAQEQGQTYTTLASMLPLLFAAEGETDSPGGTTVLGEHGAEIVKHFGGDDEVVGQNGPEVQNLEKHSQVIPIQDGYDMLKYAMKPVAQHVKSRMGNAQPQAKPETLQTMRPKFDEAVNYMRTH